MRPYIKQLVLVLAILNAFTFPAWLTVSQGLSNPKAYAADERTPIQTQKFTATGDYTLPAVSVDDFSATSEAELKAIVAKKKEVSLITQVTKMREKLIADGEKYIGVVPYVFGGATPAGWDCSGYTMYIYNEALGITLGHGVNMQVAESKEVAANMAVAGDLVAFSKKGDSNFHVGIYIGNGLMLNSPTEGESTKISSINFEAGDTMKYYDVIDSSLGLKRTSVYYIFDADAALAKYESLGLN